MGLPFSQQPGPVGPPTGVLAPPDVAPGAAPLVVAVDDGDNAPGLNAPPDDIAGEVAVVGCPPLTNSCNSNYTNIKITISNQIHVNVKIIKSLVHTLHNAIFCYSFHIFHNIIFPF